MNHFIYILRSKRNGKTYAGVTTDIQRRLGQHNRAEVSSTKNFKPYELLYTECYTDHALALKRERFLKTGKGREAMKQLLKNLVRH